MTEVESRERRKRQEKEEIESERDEKGGTQRAMNRDKGDTTKRSPRGDTKSMHLLGSNMTLSLLFYVFYFISLFYT